MQCLNQRRVELQQRFTARQHNKTALPFFRWPSFRNCVDQLFASTEASAAVAVCADKFRITELADSPRPISLTARPEIAAGKAAEHRCAPCIPTFALQRVKDLFYRVRHSSGRLHVA